MNVLFPQLPLEIENHILSFRIEQMCLNLTTGEYMSHFKPHHLKSLLKKASKRDALCLEDVGESHWRRTDKIIIVPIHLEEYVKRTYSEIKFA